MKHLLTGVIVVVAIGILYVVGKFIFGDRTDEDLSIPAVEEVEVVEAFDLDEANETPIASENESRRYYGDTLFQYDGKTIVYNNFMFMDEELASIYRSAVVTYRDTVPVNICVVNGNGKYFADGEILKFSVGVDTVYYNFKRLPKAVYPDHALLPESAKEHSYVHKFALSDKSSDCCFALHAFLPDPAPVWIKQFIATVINSDIKKILTDDDSCNILKEYYGIKNSPKEINGIDASEATPKEIGKHFAKAFERLYRKEFDEFKDEGLVQRYEYSMFVVPAWQSKDNTYVTYRFYVFYNTMGAHGFMEEYYLTFEAETGQLLGFNDLIKDKSAQKVISQLDSYFTQRKKEIGYSTDDIFESWLDEGQLESTAQALSKKSTTVYTIHGLR